MKVPPRVLLTVDLHALWSNLQVWRLTGPPLTARETDVHERSPSFQGESRLPVPHPRSSSGCKCLSRVPGARPTAQGSAPRAGTGSVPFPAVRASPRPPKRPAADRAQLFAAAVGASGEAPGRPRPQAGRGAWADEPRRFPGEVSEPAADIFCLLQSGWLMAVGRGFSAR